MFSLGWGEERQSIKSANLKLGCSRCDGLISLGFGYDGNKEGYSETSKSL